MAHARISMYLPPDINPTQAAIAYGCRALPKLNEELQSEDLLTRQKALMALCDLMHDPEHVYVAIDIGCLESLKVLLKDTNSMVRIKTTEVLHIMATHNVGREGFLEHDIIFSLSFLLDDPEAACRKNLHMVFKHLAQVPSGAQGLVNNGLIPLLVWKLQREDEEIQELLLDTLAACLMEDATEALSSRVVPFLKEKLLSTNDHIRSKAACTLIAVRLTADHGSVVPGKVAALLHPPPQSLLSRGWKKSTDFLTHRLFSLAPSQGGSSFRRSYLVFSRAPGLLLGRWETSSK
ncbi:radial spoke head 14 homolog isoform X3 [Rousettus aegyptiacus]|uniref:radial spoke head 14 homolog isoform X3 n=1 Tax=Rousettus aegyptiacus TaxID=9407 RepID=UPI00168CFA18|nr:radial spoke head 14 homolog isoform X3 [Rousettus aegyptiacus]